MGKMKWDMKRQVSLLLSVLIIDGAVLGAALGVVQGTAADGRQVRVAQEENRTLYAGREQEKSAAAVRRENQLLLAVPADGSGEALPEQKEPKYVALTFDDGPSGENTGVLLDGLKEHGVRATFFLMGENIEGNEELVRRMKEEGHLIGNHSYRHVKLTSEGVEAVCREVEKTSEMIAGITGEKPEYLRPPYGDWSEELAECVDLIPVLWSVDSLDWKYQNTDRVVRRVLKSVGDGDIILMHDIFPTTVKAALRLVDVLREQGYQFVTVEELLIE